MHYTVPLPFDYKFSFVIARAKRKLKLYIVGKARRTHGRWLALRTFKAFRIRGDLTQGYVAETCYSHKITCCSQIGDICARNVTLLPLHVSQLLVTDCYLSPTWENTWFCRCSMSLRHVPVLWLIVCEKPKAGRTLEHLAELTSSLAVCSATNSLQNSSPPHTKAYRWVHRHACPFAKQISLVCGEFSWEFCLARPWGKNLSCLIFWFSMCVGDVSF